MIRVTIWNEFRHEKKNPKVTEIYPDGIHEAIAAPCARTMSSKSARPRSISPSTGSATKS